MDDLAAMTDTSDDSVNRLAQFAAQDIEISKWALPLKVSLIQLIVQQELNSIIITTMQTAHVIHFRLHWNNELIVNVEYKLTEHHYRKN